MSKADTEKPTSGTEQGGERIDNQHREALLRFGKYRAPALVAMLASVNKGTAQIPPISNL